jgi:hypothetical protein
MKYWCLVCEDVVNFQRTYTLFMKIFYMLITNMATVRNFDILCRKINAGEMEITQKIDH